MNDMVKSEGGILVPASKITVQGQYHGQLLRNGQIIDEWVDPNLVVNEGLDSILNIYFHGSTQITTWYLGIFDGNYTPVATVTAATIAAAASENTAYTSSTRPEFVEGAASGQIITNSANRASFVFNNDATIVGAFLVSSSTKSGTSGTLFSVARFGTSKTVTSGDELLLTYSFTAASA